MEYMYKQILWVFLLLCSIGIVQAVEVQVNIDIAPQETTYRYTLNFGPDEDYNSFSFEKPTDAIVFYSKDELGEGVRHTSAGDFFIIRPSDGTEGKFFDIRFISRQSSEDITTKEAFSHYVNFNVPVTTLVYRVSLDESMGEVTEIFPRDYTVTEEGILQWSLENVEEDTLFLLNFNSENTNSPEAGLLELPWYLYVIVALIVALVVFAMLYFMTQKRGKIKEVTRIIEKKAVEKSDEDDSKIVEEKVVEETYEEIINKYLTDNEKEVVGIVKDNDGISQYDILNFAPHLTKSNLSKIISKLHAKKFLNRIRVGKVNKIYLGERLQEKE